ncbi:cyclophilin-like fold protein [Knoellia locipacati]|uniref:cyclophilin-like fold protein n=1 Tax=Knoellia locipacati TaxID=882824 RepID=UPI001FEB82AB|nr:cyclophilin-like fold protein [Knoellia locipacati]
MSSTGCASSDSSDEHLQTSPTSSTTSGTLDQRSPTAETTSTPEENLMRITISIGDEQLSATLTDSAAARDLLAQLPVTVEMVDHGGVEKTGPLPEPLSLEGQPEGADPSPGDLGYYAPGNDLVLYYGDQSYFAGIVILGRLDGDAAERISALDGPVTTVVREGQE